MKVSALASFVRVGLTLLGAQALHAQVDTSSWTTQDDHAHLLQQLGITALRPGRDGSADPDPARAANTDESHANPWPEWPALLISDTGIAIDSAAQWHSLRRAELVEHFEREVVGRLPPEIPTTSWEVVTTTAADAKVGNHAVHGRKVLGHVDNSAFPELSVDIEMSVVLPARAQGPVPILMMFGRSNLPGDPSGPSFPGAFTPSVPPSTEQLIAAGWGYALINPASIQPDNGAGLSKGIIGLVNRGQPRQPEDWGALRAWAWGAARGLDYLATLPEVDADRIGIEGVSRYGKAALVTHALEPRFAIALIGSAGEGGVSPYRRDFGEAPENLAGTGGYHWMAGNFLKYSAEAGAFGRMDANDLPIDAHMLIALCAPKPTFISYGIPENGDALWLDQQGSYMATVAASPVFELLGAAGLQEPASYQTAVKPPVNTGLLTGDLAWRQHDGGHEDRSNMPYFIEWANARLGYRAH